MKYFLQKPKGSLHKILYQAESVKFHCRCQQQCHKRVRPRYRRNCRRRGHRAAGIIDDARHHTATGGDNKVVELKFSPRAGEQEGEEWIIRRRKKKQRWYCTSSAQTKDGVEVYLLIGVEGVGGE